MRLTQSGMPRDIHLIKKGEPPHLPTLFESGWKDITVIDLSPPPL